MKVSNLIVTNLSHGKDILQSANLQSLCNSDTFRMIKSNGSRDEERGKVLDYDA